MILTLEEGRAIDLFRGHEHNCTTYRLHSTQA